MTLNTYGHVIAELADAEKVSAEELIRRARASIRPIDDAEHRDRNSRETRKPRAVAGRSDESPLPDSNRRPLPYHGSALPTELRGQKTCKSASRRRSVRELARRPYCADTARGAKIGTAAAAGGDERGGKRVHRGPV